MKRSRGSHLENYFSASGLDKGEEIFCEICYCKEGKYKRAVDIHHILPRSRGGGDKYENLIAVCRECHNDCHNHVFTREAVFEMHRKTGTITT